MKNCYLAPINLAYKYTSRLSEKNRNIMMYASVTMIVLSCYYYQIDDYIGHICPAIINAIFGMLMFGILLLSGIDRRPCTSHRTYSFRKLVIISIEP